MRKRIRVDGFKDYLELHGEELDIDAVLEALKDQGYDVQVVYEA